MWWKITAAVVVLAAAGMGLMTLIGVRRWREETGALREKMESARVRVVPATFDSREIDGFPRPVRRYFNAVLPEGAPLVAAVEVEHRGSFNVSESGEGWKPFTSTQRVVTRPPGFVWSARVHMAPAMSLSVHDAYVAGEGVLTASLFGLVTVMEQPPTPELAHGELMRYFAEGAWYPTALLPSQGVAWEPVDGRRAAATLTDGETSVRLVFTFDDRGLITTVRSDGRYREVDGAQVPTPWQGRFWDYRRRDGMLVPLEGEVAWLLPGGELPYWRGSIRRITYEYAR
ncbi:MAG: DUF6920 family protein [Spirochaetota bacterium]